MENKMPDGPNGWNAWGYHVLLELKRFSTSLEDHTKIIGEVKEELAKLRTRQNMITAGLATFISSIVAVISRFVP